MDPTPDAASPCCPDPDDGEPRLPTGGGRRSSGEDGGARSDPGGSGRDGSIYDGFGMEAVGSGEIEGRGGFGREGSSGRRKLREAERSSSGWVSKVIFVKEKVFLESTKERTAGSILKKHKDFSKKSPTTYDQKRSVLY